MMFMIGQGERIVAIGPIESHHCPGCEEVTDFEPQLRYKYAEFDLLFGWAYSRRYQLACLSCNHGWLLNAADVEKDLGHVPIPFRLRYGLPMLGVAIGILAVAAWVWHAGNSA